MINRTLKLKLNKAELAQLEDYKNILTGVYNWAIKQHENNAKYGIYLSYEDLCNLTQGHAKIIGIHSQVFQQMLKQATRAWTDYKFEGKGKPRLKGLRNKLNSFCFPQNVKRNGNRHISVPGLGTLRTHEQEIPEGKIKQARIIKQASGYYIVLTLNVEREPIKPVANKVAGADPGFETLVTLSDGTKFRAPRELERSIELLGQKQRGGNKKKVARLHEKIANQRLDRNHKISLDIVKNHVKIAVSKDNLKQMSKKFGKSVSSAAHGQLKQFIKYKSSSCGRLMIEVDNKLSTQTCCCCSKVSGPKGLAGLKVRHWSCSACGAEHDRDTCSGVNTLIKYTGLNLLQLIDVGAGIALEYKSGLNQAVIFKLYKDTLSEPDYLNKKKSFFQTGLEATSF